MKKSATNLSFSLQRISRQVQRRFSSEHKKAEDTSVGAWAKWIVNSPKYVLIWTWELTKQSVREPAAVRERWKAFKKMIWDEVLHYWQGTKLLYYNTSEAKK